MMYNVDIYGGNHAEIPSVTIPFIPKKGQFIQYFNEGESHRGKIIEVNILTLDGNFVGFDIQIEPE